jgi:DNA polymerase V
MSELIRLSELPTLVPVIWPIKPTAKAVDNPHFPARRPTGFPSPAADYVESGVDLNDYLVKHRVSTFIFDVCGESMRHAGIFDGDRIVVDRSVEAGHGAIVVVVLNGEYTVKRLHARGDGVELRAANPGYPPVFVREGEELVIFGVVVGVVRKLQP